MRSGSFERGDQPRSVDDPDRQAYEKMIRDSRALADRRFDDASQNDHSPDVGHPGPLESLIPIWGSGREALADLHDHNYVGAAVNGVFAASDVVLGKALAGGLLKGGLKTAGSHAWQSAPWEAESTRRWLGRKGFLEAGQPGHHWAFEQKSPLPDWFKNQPPWIKGTADAVDHGRIHGPYTVNGQRLPQYNAVQRFWHGTPDWFKGLNVSAPGHAGTAVGRKKAAE